jgi:hypothetical protein
MGSANSNMDISETRPNGRNRELVTGIDLQQGEKYVISGIVDVRKGQKVIIGDNVYTHNPSHRTPYTRFDDVNFVDVSLQAE